MTRREDSTALSLADAIAICFLSVASIGFLFPPLRASIASFSVLSTVMFIAWGAIAFIQWPDFFLRPTMQRGATLLFLIYVAIFPLFFNNDVISNRYLGVAPLFLYYMVYEFYRETHRLRAVGIVIIACVPFLLATCINTMRALIASPWLSRSIKSSGEYSQTLLAQGIGGYELVYTLVPLSVILAYIAFVERGTVLFRWRIVALAFLGLFLATIVLANYFTALVAVLGGLFLMALFAAARRSVVLSIILAGIVGVFTLWDGWTRLVMWSASLLSQVAPGGKNAARLESLLTDEDIYGGRFLTLQESLFAFKDSPVFGLSVSPIHTSGGYLVGFGQHSHLLDTFALYGLVIGAAQVIVLFSVFFAGFRLSRACLPLSIPMIFVTVVILGLDNAVSGFGLAAFLVYPWVADMSSAQVPGLFGRGIAGGHRRVKDGRA